MAKKIEELSKSKQIAAKTVYEALKILKEANGQLEGKEVINKIRENLKFNEWELERYEKTGYVRWESILHFYTIDCLKAGFLRKNKGVWYLTEDGEKALKLSPVELLENASLLYKKWQSENKKNNNNGEIENPILENDIEPELNNPQQIQKASLDKLEEEAFSGIKEYISNKNPYEFQDLVAALLRSMGYHTPFISPKGKDGGLDIIAYLDPLGVQSPRIKVQVKHRPQASISVDEIRSLIGLLNKDGDIGLFITSGRFTSEAEKFSRDSHIHVKLVDFENFIFLWQENYHKLTDEDKNLLPLHPIYFLGSNE